MQALLNTVKYAIVEVPFSIIIALVLAVLFELKMEKAFCIQNHYFPYGSGAGCSCYGLEMAV